MLQQQFCLSSAVTQIEMLFCSDETSTPRRRSLRKSLRESFRHLRKRRMPNIPLLHRRARTESKSAAAAEADAGKPAEEGKTEQPSPSSAPAATAAAWVQVLHLCITVPIACLFNKLVSQSVSQSLYCGTYVVFIV